LISGQMWELRASIAPVMTDVRYTPCIWLRIVALAVYLFITLYYAALPLRGQNKVITVRNVEGNGAYGNYKPTRRVGVTAV
jgi:hypothetical protein